MFVLNSFCAKRKLAKQMEQDSDLHSNTNESDVFDLEKFRNRVKKGNDPQSPVRETLNRIGDRWTPLILMTLRSGVMRYSQLLKEMNSMADTPVSQRILTLKLRASERDGFVSRKVIPTIPPQVEYTLTPHGLELSKELEKLIQWIEKSSAYIEHARADFDGKNIDKS
ncbi:winged helix-turn-helix transcriptional regulator [Acinetobacter gerneri]|uniref:winged helix-turn-helix transcriptional regulator n=1 Tax=Acinetobacter gerneri TaxID=202952 RepID=UPI003A8366A0